MRTTFLKKITPYILLLPVSVLLAIFLMGLVNGIEQSFGYAPYAGLTEPTLDYYVAAMSQYQLTDSIVYSIVLSAAYTICAAAGAIALSAALTRLKAGPQTKLFALSVPLSVAHIVVVLMVVIMCGSSGMIARVLFALGLIQDAQTLPSVIGAYTGWGIILVFMFKEIPYITLCTITLMSNIGNSFSEASACLGASPIRTFFTVTLPLCKSPIIRASLVVFAFAFGSYEIPYLLGTTNPKTIAVMAFYEFQNNDIVNRSYAMTLITMMILITLIVAIAYFVLMNRESRGSRRNVGRARGGDALRHDSDAVMFAGSGGGGASRAATSTYAVKHSSADAKMAGGGRHD